MSEKIQVRRGTDAERLTVTLDQGEPCWVTDKKRLYLGDGVTVGGVLMNPITNAPASSTSIGVSGQIAFGSSYLYAATGTNLWGRVLLSNF